MPAQNYGAASKYDFDNPSKWHTVTSVPVLDEHEMTDEQGRPMTEVDARVLQEIAANNNKRVQQTGDPAPLIIGHTSDDPRAPEKPVAGFAVNYHVKPFKRDETGRVVYAIHVDYKLRPKFRNAAEDYPRRSVELWWSKKELDPIALLGGTTPERDLGVIVRKARLKAVSLLGGSTPARDMGITVRYDRKGDTVFRYAMSDGGSAMPCAPGDAMNYADDEAPPTDDLPPDDEQGFGGGDEAGEEEDPVVAKVFQSRQWKEMQSTLDEIKQAIMGDDMGGAPPGGDQMMGEGPPGGAPMDDGMGADDLAGAGVPGGGPPGAGRMPEEEARGFHDEPPVRFEHSSGFAGPGSVNTPAFGGGSRPFARNGRSSMPAAPTAGPRSATGFPRKPQGQQHPDVIRMQRQVAQMARSHQALQLKLARSEAEKIVNRLATVDGIDFADVDGKNAERNMANTAAFLAQLDDQSRDHFVNQTIKKHYRRRQPDPVHYAAEHANGVAVWSRPEPGTKPDDPNEYVPSTPREAMEYAALITEKKMSIPDAVKYMRSGRAQRA